MRSLLIGFFSGLLLSALRAPLGVELLQVPATTSGAALAYRAAALLVIGVGLIFGLKRSADRISPTNLLVGAVLGYQLHWQLVDTPGPFVVQVVFSILLVTLLVAGHRGRPDSRPDKVRIIFLALAALGGWYLLDSGYPESHRGAVGSAMVGLVCITIVGRMTNGASQAQSSSSPPVGRLSSIAVCGAGLAILSEGLARHLRLLGSGHLEDDSVFGTVFLGLAAFAAISFARLFKERRAVLLASGCAAGASGLAAWGGFRVLENLATNRGLDIYVRQFDAIGMDWDLGIHGRWEYDLIVAGPILVIAAFFCGTVIGVQRRPLELTALLLGASVGLVLSPSLLEFEWSATADDGAGLVSSSHSAAMALFGGLIAAGGALLMFLTADDLGKVPRLVGCLVALGGIAICKFPERQAIEILSPWLKSEPQVMWVLDSPNGLVTVEPDAEGEPFATLNRRHITPDSAATPADQRRIYQSFELLGEWTLDEGPRVLFVGQLNADRALFMSDLGARGIDRTASWYPEMEAIEHQLFGGTPKWFPGKILSLGDARMAIDRGEYDLVIVPAIEGDAPTTRNFASPRDTTVVVWFDASSGIETQHLGEFVLATAPGLSELFVGLARGPQVEEVRLEGGFGSLAFMEAGTATPGMPALEFLSKRKPERLDQRRARLARRLAGAERSPGVADGLRSHFESQVPSSPYLSPASQIELVPEAAQRFSEAAAGEEPTTLEIEVIETLAYLYGAQRKIEEIDKYLTSPAERHAPWAALEIALGQAALEFLEPEAALVNLARAHQNWSGSPVTWAMQAEAQQQSGDDLGAVSSLERAQAMDPTSHEIERRLAIAWKRAGDPRGAEAVRSALAEAPEDPGLLAHQGDGPFPAPPAGFHPLSGHGH